MASRLVAKWDREMMTAFLLEAPGRYCKVLCILAYKKKLVGVLDGWAIYWFRLQLDSELLATTQVAPRNIPLPMTEQLPHRITDCWSW